ncbi:MAG: protein kinase domain-containing protein [Gemmataceae bacterium]
MNERSSAEDVFFAALEKATLTERAAYLEEACAGNEALRRRVEALLAAHLRVGQFLERPVVAAEGVAALAEVENPAADLSFLASSSEPGSLGRLDHYEILEVVGHGGMGVVLRARDSKLQRVVAIKVLAAPLAVSGTARQRFVREARAAAAVRDEHVIDIHAVRDDGPVPYLVMEFIDGCTLEALIRRGGPLEVKEVLRIGIQVASGLAAAHKQGLIHRDVKPANILLENGVQRVKLTDFGLARAADDARLTQSGLIACTPLYMAPEQAAGEPIGPRADLFSLGSVLYELCTGRPAFRAANMVAVIKRVCEETPRPIREVNPDIPEPLCRVIDRLHAKKPAGRPASAKEVADLLARLLAGLQGQGPGALSSSSTPPPAPPRRTVSSRPWRRWAAAALVLLVVGLGLGEATGVTDVRGTVIRLFSPEGTLVVEVDDPGVSVAVDGADVVITGAGVKEIRLKPGQYKVEASRDGKVVRQELVTVARNGRQVVRISKEAKRLTAAEAWEKSVAALPAAQQVKAVVQRLKVRNPFFDCQIEPTIQGQVVTGLRFNTDVVDDISPVRALTRLESLICYGTAPKMGRLIDLSPLRGLPLRRLTFSDNQVKDLSPLREMPLKRLDLARNLGVKDLTPLKGMPLEFLDCSHTCVTELSPLKGMKLTALWCDQTLVSDLTPLRGLALKDLRIPYTKVSDLTPLKGMPLEILWLIKTPVSDLSPLRGMPLKELGLTDSQVTDLSPLRGMPLTKLWCRFQRARDGEIVRSFTKLRIINDKPAAEFWKEVGDQ